MARKPMMAGNWKMNNTIPEAVVLTQEISNRLKYEWEKVDVVLCVPYTALKPVLTVLEYDKVEAKVASQNVFWEEKGAFTGEVSVGMIKGVGCKYSVVGHSERREMFGETDETVNKKAKALVAAGLGAIVCVGESLEVRDAGTTLDFVCAQVKAAFAGLSVPEAQKCVVAYEPVWAIGTGRTATPEQAEEVCAAIRAALAAQFDAATAEGMRILYGGSMNPGNVDMLLAQEDIDGGLVGGASLEAPSFVQLVQACLK
ncbi:MAG: triose-phosphate isomerase [Eggerthellaceae bacterium]|nr:triose-phosphate isomerase [Eggerthellaceae bacterium]